MNTSNLFVIFGIIIMVAGAGVSVWNFINPLIDSDDEIKLTSCYDRYNNKIQGLTCEDKYVDDVAAISFLVILLGFFILGMGKLLKYSEEWDREW